jgi:hypothetical protein
MSDNYPTRLSVRHVLQRRLCPLTHPIRQTWQLPPCASHLPARASQLATRNFRMEPKKKSQRTIKYGSLPNPNRNIRRTSRLAATSLATRTPPLPKSKPKLEYSHVLGTSQLAATGTHLVHPPLPSARPRHYQYPNHRMNISTHIATRKHLVLAPHDLRSHLASHRYHNPIPKKNYHSYL